MKKLFSLVLSIILIFAFSACSDSESTDTNSGSDVTSSESKLEGRIITYDDFLTEIVKYVDIDSYIKDDGNFGSTHIYNYLSATNCEIENKQSNYEVVIDGVKITLPMTVKELVNLGFKVDYFESETELDLNATESECTFTVTTSKNNTFLIRAKAKNGEQAPIKDLVIIRLSCDFYDTTPEYSKNERKDTPEIIFCEKLGSKSTFESILNDFKTPSEIVFTETKEEGKTTLSATQLTFNFSNEQYEGSIIANVYPVTDAAIDRTSYVFYYTYNIDAKNSQ